MTKQWVEDQRLQRLNFKRKRPLRSNSNKRPYATSSHNAKGGMVNPYQDMYSSNSGLGHSCSQKLERPTTSLRKKFSIKRQKVIKEYLKSQKIVLAREIPLPRSKKVEFRLRLLDCKEFIKNIEMKHLKDGVMRRNKLLLEHILCDRLGDKVH